MDIAIRKTARAKLAAKELGFQNTSNDLNALHRHLLGFKDLGELDRNFSAYEIEGQIKKTQSTYVDEATHCDKAIELRFSAIMGRTFLIANTVSFLSMSCLLFGTIEAAARDAKAVLTVNAAVTAVTLGFCYLILPALQMSIFHKMVRKNIAAINEAIQECKKLLVPYMPGHSSSPS